MSKHGRSRQRWYKGGDHAYQAFRILQFIFIAGPILAGLDKFFYILTNWSTYLSPLLLKMVGNHDRGFIMFVGLIEIIAGIGIIARPRLFSYIISVWMLCVVINLLLTGYYFDLILRDIGLFLAAFALARLSRKYA